MFLRSVMFTPHGYAHAAAGTSLEGRGRGGGGRERGGVSYLSPKKKLVQGLSLPNLKRKKQKKIKMKNM